MTPTWGLYYSRSPKGRALVGRNGVRCVFIHAVPSQDKAVLISTHHVESIPPLINDQAFNFQLHHISFLPVNSCLSSVAVTKKDFFKSHLITLFKKTFSPEVKFSSLPRESALSHGHVILYFCLLWPWPHAWHSDNPKYFAHRSSSYPTMPWEPGFKSHLCTARRTINLLMRSMGHLFTKMFKALAKW